jgi:HAD superfamily phosphoserine phosphatase-like hydrolase
VKLFAFDFDKTITVCDTILPISRYLSNSLNQKYKFRIIQFYFVLFRFHLISGKSFKEKIISTLLYGKRQDIIENIITEFYKNYYSTLFNHEIVELIRAEKEKGNKVINITSNLDLFVNPIKNILRIDDIFATNVEVSANVIGDKIKGKNCTGNVKAEVLMRYKSTNDFEKTIAYGDSSGDFAMLYKADEGFIAEYTSKNFIEKLQYRLKNLNGSIPTNFNIVFKKFSEKNSAEG